MRMNQVFGETQYRELRECFEGINNYYSTFQNVEEKF